MHDTCFTNAMIHCNKSGVSLGAYHHSTNAVDVPQGQGDVDEHNGIADYYGSDVTVALSVYLVFNTPLSTEGYGEVGIFKVLHEFDEPEKHTHNNYIE